MQEKNIFSNKENIKKHLSFFGCTGSGKYSCFAESSIEIMKDGQVEKYNENQEKIKKIEKDLKIKRNYLMLFKTLDEIYEEHYLIFEYSNLFLKTEIKDIETFKIIFFNIPQNLFGMGISYGFNDSVYRDDLYCFFENKNYKEFKNFYNEYKGFCK